MDAADFEKVRACFDSASELSGRERAAFLETHCQDPLVRARVEALLAAHDQPDEFMSTPAADLTSLRTFADQPDRQSGPDLLLNFTLSQYRITSVLGIGGMGVVYKAEQQATQRPVALKVIRSVFADSGLLRRFRQESLVLGRLKHPGIAQIYEAGTAPGPDGRDVPFFAMELVTGRPLLAYAAELYLRERLETFARICDAVSHAHQKGVIHRDLKPGNILIEEDAGAATGSTGFSNTATFGPQPKILDFGVARLTDIDALATMQTDVGQVIGTLAYMSPEQIRGETDRLDPRSDIYSLGVILCELLTGQLPYSVKGKSIAQAARIVSEDDPTIHSASVRALKGDVETIIHKSLAKEPDRRYQSATELAADIRRHLASMPIIARPATASYQIRKFASRNKALVGGVFATMVVLVLGIVGTTIGMVRAGDARVLAEKREKTAISEARKASKAIDFLTNMLTASRPEDALGRDVTVRELLDIASVRVEGELSDEPEVLASVRDAIGRTYLSLGKADAAAAHVEDAAAKRRQIYGENSPEYAASLESLAALAGARKNYPLQIELMDRNVRILAQQTSTTDSKLAVAKYLLGHAYVEAGRYSDATELLRAAVTELEKSGPGYRKDMAVALSALSSALLRAGGSANDEEARQAIDRSNAILRQLLGDSHPLVADGLFDQGFLFLQLKDLAGAEACFRECLKIRAALYAPDHPKILSVRNSIGTALTRQGKLDEAEKELNEVLALRRQALGPRHADVGRTLEELAAIAARRPDVARQQQLLTEAVDVLRSEGGVRFANATHDLALLKARSTTPAEAEPLFQAALEVRRRLGQRSSNLAILLSDFGGFLAAQNRAAEALPMLKEASQMLNEMAPTSPNTATTDRRLAGAFCRLDKRAEAQSAFERALKTARSSKNQSVLAAVIKDYAGRLEEWGEGELAKAVRAATMD